MNLYRRPRDSYSDPKRWVKEGFERIQHIIYFQRRFKSLVSYKKREKNISYVQSSILRRKELVISTKIDICNKFIQETWRLLF